MGGWADGCVGGWVGGCSHDLCISILTNTCTMLEKHAWQKKYVQTLQHKYFY